ncbi:peptidase inhibitor family I36 protein [Streptomyces sp. NPDC002659]|uniref:peptidase inhibitor family I36 protein n=1 Tax=Streptomyces sp. NPDC002659 TaxID=3364656 RepID=UPI0036BB0724
MIRFSIRTKAARIFAACTVAAAVLAGAGATAQAAPQPATEGGSKAGHGVIASLRGERVDLSKGWQGGKACVVLTRTDVRCYASYAEANAASPANSHSSQTHAATPNRVLGTANCPSGWVCIYEHSNFDGRRLQFSDEYWMSLAPYGFERMTSSWHNNQDCAWWQGKSDAGILGNGSGWNLGMPACSRATSIGSYNDVAVDIHG